MAVVCFDSNIFFYLAKPTFYKEDLLPSLTFLSKNRSSGIVCILNQVEEIFPNNSRINCVQVGNIVLHKIVFGIASLIKFSDNVDVIVLHYNNKLAIYVCNNG